MLFDKIKKCFKKNPEEIEVFEENSFVQKKFFRVHKQSKKHESLQGTINNDSKVYSLADLVWHSDVEKFIYKVDMVDISEVARRIYFQFKVTLLDSKNDDLSIMQIVDVSDSIFYSEQKTQNEFLEIVNATVSHELRNPLNSLKAQNILKRNLYNQLHLNLSSYNVDTSDSEKILMELEEGLDI